MKGGIRKREGMKQKDDTIGMKLSSCVSIDA
jgi:hypothetical protein